MAKKKKKFPPNVFLPFIIIGALTLVFALFKFTTSETEHVYVKIKVSQGFWWASSAKPNIWYAQAIKKGDVEYDLLRKPIAEILEVRYYPFFSEAQQTEDKYDIYLKVKLTASYDNRKEQYIFKRSSVVVGSPIELETLSSQISGTVIEVSESEFEDKYIEKVITLVKEEGFSNNNPYLFNSIKVGDKYFDGEGVVFEILDKKLQKTTLLVSDQLGNIYTRQSPSMQNIIIKAKVVVKEINGLIFFGEEKLLTSGDSLVISLPSFKLDEDFIIGDIK